MSIRFHLWFKEKMTQPAKLKIPPPKTQDSEEQCGSPRPYKRLRRLRRSEALRRLVRENSLSPDDFILPVFVEEGIDTPVPVPSMPGVMRETEKSLTKALKSAENANIPAIILFGVSHHKDHTGSDSLRPGGLLDRMVKRAKDACPDMLVIADLCFCEYTDHGHCGPLAPCGDVDNDRAIDNIARQAVIAAEAGADILAPSGMMDGQVRAIRTALDREGFTDRAILAYAAKYASAFYGPFRDAAGCGLGTTSKGAGDRKAYQMDPANSDEALREVDLDIAEGADMVMVKPGLPYLDIVRRIKDEFRLPTMAYHVSGEYAMLHAAAEKGWLNYEETLMESLLAFKRAGADAILTYAALDACRILDR